MGMLAQRCTFPVAGLERDSLSQAQGDPRLTTEGDDVATVFMDELARDCLFHDLLYLEGRDNGEGNQRDPERRPTMLLLRAFSGCLECSDNRFPSTSPSLLSSAGLRFL